MSNSVWPHHRWQPTRLPQPQDSLGKNTRVGCHFLPQCMKVKNESEVAQSCLTLSNPMDCSLPGSSIHRIFQARVVEWGAITFSEFCFLAQAYVVGREEEACHVIWIGNIWHRLLHIFTGLCGIMRSMEVLLKM